MRTSHLPACARYLRKGQQSMTTGLPIALTGSGSRIAIDKWYGLLWSMAGILISWRLMLPIMQSLTVPVTGRCTRSAFPLYPPAKFKHSIYSWRTFFFSSRVRLPFLRIIRSTWELPCELWILLWFFKRAFWKCLLWNGKTLASTSILSVKKSKSSI